MVERNRPSSNRPANSPHSSADSTGGVTAWPTSVQPLSQIAPRQRVDTLSDVGAEVGRSWSSGSSRSGWCSTYRQRLRPRFREIGAPRAWRPTGSLDSQSRVYWSIPLPPPPPSHVRRRRRPGAGGPHAVQRRRARQGAPRLPVRGLAGDRQDQHRQDPGRLPELRAGPDHRSLAASASRVSPSPTRPRST